MYLPSILSISGIVLTIFSTSSSLITDLQAVLLMVLAISLILAGTLKISISVCSESRHARHLLDWVRRPCSAG